MRKLGVGRWVGWNEMRSGVWKRSKSKMQKPKRRKGTLLLSVFAPLINCALISSKGFV